MCEQPRIQWHRQGDLPQKGPKWNSPLSNMLEMIAFDRFTIAKTWPLINGLGTTLLVWYTRLPVPRGLPNPIFVCTNKRTCSFSSVIASISYKFFHWSRPHVGLAIRAILRGWVNCTKFQRYSLVSGHVFMPVSVQAWETWLSEHLVQAMVNYPEAVMLGNHHWKPALKMLLFNQEYNSSASQLAMVN